MGWLAAYDVGCPDTCYRNLRISVASSSTAARIAGYCSQSCCFGGSASPNTFDGQVKGGPQEQMQKSNRIFDDLISAL
jgi:hypothetical protein